MRSNINNACWIVAFIGLLNLAKWVHGAGSLSVPLTIMHSATAKGAVCLDGSPPAYHFSPGTGSGAKNWLIDIEGGGWCNNRRTCEFRKTTRHGSSKFMEPRIEFNGILSNIPEENPDFHNWNKARIRYCDGASFASEGHDEASGLFFRGQRIWDAAMEEMMEKGMKDADKVLLTGCSAGGLSTILHCDQFGAMFHGKNTTVKCLADAGMFLNATDVGGGHSLQTMYDGVVNYLGVAKNLPETCTSHMNATSCFFPENLIDHIKTPIFLLNSAYDVWQIQESLANGGADRKGEWKNCRRDYRTCTDDQIKFLQGFREKMLNVTKNFVEAKKTGVFINSCFTHCQRFPEIWTGDKPPTIGNKTIAKSVGDWYFERAPAKEIDCAYPCDKTCHHVVQETGSGAGKPLMDTLMDIL